MNFLKGIGAFLYSFVHSWLINLIVIGMLFIIAKILTLSWFWILIIVLFLIGIIEALRSLLLGLVVIPYFKLANKSSKVLILPIIVLIINAIWFCYRAWTFDGIEAPRSYFIIYNLIATYEMIIATWHSIMMMLGGAEEY